MKPGEEVRGGKRQSVFHGGGTAGAAEAQGVPCTQEGALQQVDHDF